MTPKGFDKDPTADAYVCLDIDIKVGIFKSFQFYNLSKKMISI